MTDATTAALDYAHARAEETLKELKELVAIPSVSTDPEHQADMQRAAQWLVRKLAAIGVEPQIFQTEGHPVVYAENLSAGVDKPTILIYGHYDVQPPDPLDQWTNPPFQPEIQDGTISGRGISDMKGQVIDTITAVDAVLRQGLPPVNFKFLIEGEEEIGSPHLADFLNQHRQLLACDVVLNPDSGMVTPENPAITYGLRGLAYFELRVFGPSHDLHSGTFGGVVHNPAQAICELIAGMHDKEGRVTLQGFYDRVLPVSNQERAELARLPVNEAVYLAQTGASALWGDQDYSPAERIGIRPTLEVHGLLSGFTGPGTKTVIPSWAMAKISCRLVPDQKPDEVYQQLKQYLEEHAPETIRWELTHFAGGSPGIITDLDLPATKALANALETVWGIPPVYKREGGSIPVVSAMQEILGVQSVITGFGLPDDNYHAPNEHLNLSTWSRGLDALILFFYNLGKFGN